MGHKHQYTETTRIKRLIAEGVTAEVLAKEFGVNKESVNNWIKNGSAPYWTRCACEALERRRGKSSRKIIVCEVSNPVADIILAIIKSGDGEAHVIGNR